MTVDRSGLPALLALKDALVKSIDALVADEQAAIPSIPSADGITIPTPYPPTANGVDAIHASREIVAMLQGPMGTLEVALQFHVVAALRVAIEAHAAETIREAAISSGENGLHVDAIAKSSNIAPAKLARILRVLAAHRIFVEVSPDTFANNNFSLFLCKCKSVEELNNTLDIYSSSSGIPALISHAADDILRGSGHLSDVLQDPKTSHSYAPADAASPRAWQGEGGGEPVPTWEYFGRPGNEARLMRFGAAMRGVGSVFQGWENGFPFAELPEGAVAVDVGAGVGASAVEIRKLAPKLKVVLQDREEVIQGETTKFWENTAPEALKSGAVKLVAQDFFTAQPVKGANVYFLRMIIHDWSDPDCLTILRHLSTAASTSSRLVLIEQTYSYLPSDGSMPPSPFPYLTDLQMMTALNAQERTEEQYMKLGKESGWKWVKTYRTGPGGSEGANRHYEFVLAGEEGK